MVQRCRGAGVHGAEVDGAGRPRSMISRNKLSGETPLIWRKMGYIWRPGARGGEAGHAAC